MKKANQNNVLPNASSIGMLLFYFVGILWQLGLLCFVLYLIILTIRYIWGVYLIEWFKLLFLDVMFNCF